MLIYTMQPAAATSPSQMMDKGVVSLFDSNSEIGLFAASSGNIFVTSISASSNGSGGAVLNNCILSGDYCLGNGSVYVRSAGTVNKFNSNQLYGLSIYSSGHVYLYDVQADANGYSGLYVKNQYLLETGNVTLKTSKNFISSFSGNGWKNPLDTYSNRGLLERCSIAHWRQRGRQLRRRRIYRQRCHCIGAHVFLYDTNFEANQGNGLWVNSNGSIYLTGVQSRYNSVNNGQIDLLGETIFEHLTPYYESDTWWFDGFTDDAVDIILESDEFDVLLEVFDKDGNLIATDDDSYGVTDARLTFTLPANGNYYIRVSASDGETGNYTLTLNDEALEYPTMYRFSGAHLDNDGGSGNIVITTSVFNEAPNFYHNNYDGLEILTAGSVTLLNLSAMQNGEDGINIDSTAGSGAVLISSTSKRYQFIQLQHQIRPVHRSRGNVSIINNGRMFLRDNSYTGAYIDNTSANGAYVIVYKAEVNQNTLKGLEIHSSGNVTTNNILAVNNGSNGIFVDNTYGSGTISLLGSMGENNISDNGASGLALYSNSGITVDNVIAIQNGGNGSDSQQRVRQRYYHRHQCRHAPERQRRHANQIRRSLRDAKIHPKHV